MKFGHRGSNQPVKDLATGKIYITSQNHSFAIDEDSIEDTDLEITQINLLVEVNDISELTNLMKKIKAIPGVDDVFRVRN